MVGDEDSLSDSGVDPDAGFDIGLRDESLRAHRPHGRRRDLPRWAVGAVALLVGFVVGAVVGPTQLDERADRDQDEAVERADRDRNEAVERGERPVTDGDALSAARSPAGETPGPVVGPDVGRETVAVAELSGADRLPSSIITISATGTTSTVVQGRLAGPTQASIGHVDNRVHVSGDRLVFVADRAAMSLQPGGSPIRLVDAVSLLPGPERGTLWVLGVDPRKITLVDIDLAAVVGTYDLSGVGTVLSSFGGGLVVEPVSGPESTGAFALWSPGDGLKTIWGVDAATEFIDAAGDRIVFQTADGLARFNAVTGRIDGVDVSLTAQQRSRAFLSPSGRQLAVIGRLPVEGQRRVRIHDLDTGNVVDDFVVSAEWLLHWVSDGELVYTSAEDVDDVRLRDTAAGTSRSLARLPGPATWVTVMGVGT